MLLGVQTANMQAWKQGTREGAVAASGQRTREAIVGWRKGDRFEIFRKQNGPDLMMDPM